MAWWVQQILNIEKLPPTISDQQILVKIAIYRSTRRKEIGWWINRVICPPSLGEVMRAGSRKWLNRNTQISRRATWCKQRCWQDYAVVAPAGPMGVNKLPPGVSPEMMLSVLGITGMTAYFGTGHWPTQTGDTVRVRRGRRHRLSSRTNR